MSFSIDDDDDDDDPDNTENSDDTEDSDGLVLIMIVSTRMQYMTWDMQYDRMTCHAMS